MKINLKKPERAIIFAAVSMVVLSSMIVFVSAFSEYGISKTRASGTSPAQTHIINDVPCITWEAAKKPADLSLILNKENLGTMMALSDDGGSQQEIRALVEAFGKKLQYVSLSAPEDMVATSIKENYSDYVTSELLQKWLADPQSAPGRTMSSPWPYRIDILGLQTGDKNQYIVQGEVLEVTGAELADGGAAAKRPVTVVVQKVNGCWLISSLTTGEVEEILKSRPLWPANPSGKSIEAEEIQEKEIEIKFDPHIGQDGNTFSIKPSGTMKPSPELLEEARKSKEEAKRIRTGLFNTKLDIKREENRLLASISFYNISQEDLKLDFDVGCEFDFIVTDSEDGEVYSRFHGSEISLPAIHHHKLKKGEKLSFSYTWNYIDNNGNTIAPGKYSVAAKMLPMLNYKRNFSPDELTAVKDIDVD